MIHERRPGRADVLLLNGPGSAVAAAAAAALPPLTSFFLPLARPPPPSSPSRCCHPPPFWARLRGVLGAARREGEVGGHCAVRGGGRWGVLEGGGGTVGFSDEAQRRAD